MKKLSLILLSILALTLVSCKKDNVNPDKPKSIEDLQISANFDWKTTQNVSVLIQGLQVPVSVSRTVYIASPEGQEFYKGMQAINANMTYNLVVPAYLREVKVSFGTISKTLPIRNGIVAFDYIPDLPQTDN
ncbi:MAG: hypothetical protein LWX09_04295 [Bacteroidia bacterium]|jgi:hypothetical protein|nr:hypothetical protein [Bacteroidia bacterium]